jgi:hypothetical protein
MIPKEENQAQGPRNNQNSTKTKRLDKTKNNQQQNKKKTTEAASSQAVAHTATCRTHVLMN